MSVGRRAEPGPFDVIAEALDEPAGRATFMRGLMLGALVGAAVVGSVLRARQARRPRPQPVLPAPVLPAPEPGELGSAGEAAIGSGPPDDGSPGAAPTS